MKYLPQSEYSHLSQNEITTPSPLPHDHSVRQDAVLSIHSIQIHHNQLDQHSTLYTTTSSNNCTSYHTIYNNTPSHLLSSNLISIIHTSPHSIYPILPHYPIYLIRMADMRSLYNTTHNTHSSYLTTINYSTDNEIKLCYYYRISVTYHHTTTVYTTHHC